MVNMGDDAEISNVRCVHLLKCRARGQVTSVRGIVNSERLALRPATGMTRGTYSQIAPKEKIICRASPRLPGSRSRIQPSDLNLAQTLASKARDRCSRTWFNRLSHKSNKWRLGGLATGMFLRLTGSVTVKGLSGAGINFVRVPGLPQDESGIWSPAPGIFVAWFRDPDGNMLSVAQH